MNRVVKELRPLKKDIKQVHRGKRRAARSRVIGGAEARGSSQQRDQREEELRAVKHEAQRVWLELGRGHTV